MRYYYLKLLFILPLGLTTGCKQGTGGAGAHATPPSKIVLQRNVDLTTVQQRALVYPVETIGVIEAEGQTDIAAGSDTIAPGGSLVRLSIRYGVERIRSGVRSIRAARPDSSCTCFP